MNITKCDVCGKAVKEGRPKLSIGGKAIKGWSVDVCEKCSAPYLALLKKSDLVKIEC